jgi:hypothetical protein
MDGIKRRKFLKLAGAGSAAAAVAGAGAISTGLVNTGDKTGSGTITFRAVAGKPEAPLPSYASFVLEGHVDVANQSGILTKTVFAGTPEARSNIAFPGMSQIVRITEVQEQDGLLHVKGMVDDRSQLQPGERPEFEMQLDPGQGVIKTHFFGKENMLYIEK